MNTGLEDVCGNVQKCVLRLEGRCSIQLSYGRTEFATFHRRIPLDTYFARFRVQGKLIRKSLKTDAFCGGFQ